MKRGTATVLVLVAAAWIVVGARQLAATRADRARDEAASEELRIHEADIAFYEARVARDPGGAQDRATLARLYLQHARETGTYDDNMRAESLALRSLAMRTAHNAAAYGILATALLAQHRFPEALAAAESLVAMEPWVPAHRAMLGEIAFETGRYDMARALFDSLRADARALDVAPRMSRWAELNGQTAHARTLLRVAYDEARALRHLPRETVAWFALRAGDLESRAGNLDSAEHFYLEGLALHPGDYRVLSALARVNLERGRPRDAVRYGEEALQTVLDPATLATLSEAHRALGDDAKAEEFAQAMELVVTTQPGAIHRQWALFLLDRGRSVDDIAERAEAELRARSDIYGYDVLAWARFMQRRLPEAKIAMASALRLGTRDPLLDRHNAAINR